MSDEIRKRLAERLKGWRLLPNVQVALLPFLATAVFPLDGSRLALSLRFEARKTPTDRTPEQLQVALSLQDCKLLAEQLREGIEFLENELKPGPGKPN